MDGISIASGPLWFAQERDVGLRYIGMDVFQADTHGANGDGKVLEAGEEVEKMMGGEGKFSGLDTLRSKLQSAKGQGRGQSRRGRGEGGGTPRGRG